jgi:hypothetical protein
MTIWPTSGSSVTKPEEVAIDWIVHGFTVIDGGMVNSLPRRI